MLHSRRDSFHVPWSTIVLADSGKGGFYLFRDGVSSIFSPNPVKSWKILNFHIQMACQVGLFVINSPPLSRGCSSVGRALAWHARGREFESHQLHCTTDCHHMGCGCHFNGVLLRNSHGSDRTEIGVSQVWVGRNSLTNTRFGRYDANFYRIIV